MYKREIETVTTVREQCEKCEGTGLIHDKGYTNDCLQCAGRGMVQVSRKKEIKRERKRD